MPAPCCPRQWCSSVLMLCIYTDIYSGQQHIHHCPITANRGGVYSSNLCRRFVPVTSQALCLFMAAHASVFDHRCPLYPRRCHPHFHCFHDRLDDEYPIPGSVGVSLVLNDTSSVVLLFTFLFNPLHYTGQAASTECVPHTQSRPN